MIKLLKSRFLTEWQRQGILFHEQHKNVGHHQGIDPVYSEDYEHTSYRRQ